jgi:hypothetical protein
MFSDLETLALICLSRSIDDDRRRAHASAMVQQLGLDERLEPLVPLPPSRRRLRRTYDDAIASLSAVSELPEPQRTTLIDEIFLAVERDKKK